MTKPNISLDRNIIYPTHNPYPPRSYDLLQTSNATSCSSTFPITLDVTEAQQWSQTERETLPSFYLDNRLYIHHALTSARFLSLGEDYSHQVAILALSDYTNVSPIVQCGKYGSGLCHKERLCPYCARNKATERWSTYKNLYDAASGWTIITVSYDGHMSFSEHDHTRWILHWAAATEGIKRLTKSSYISGAFVREELSIDSYLPQRVKPHVHALVSTSTANLDYNWEKVLLSFVEGYRDDDGNCIDLPPDISAESITDFQHFNRAFYYMQKAVDLVTPYRSFLNLNPARLPSDLARLNRAARDFPESYLVGSYGRTQRLYLGNLDKRTKFYLGNSYAPQ